MLRKLGSSFAVLLVALALAGCPGGTAPVADARWDAAAWDGARWAP